MLLSGNGLQMLKEIGGTERSLELGAYDDVYLLLHAVYEVLTFTFKLCGYFSHYETLKLHIIAIQFT